MTDLQRELLAVVFGQTGQPHPVEQHPLLGKNVFIRTVTYHYTGRLVAVVGGYLKLEQAAWIADSGRWSQAMATGQLNEVEPYPDDLQVYVKCDSEVEIVEWRHPLPRDQK